jgi:hypothetical protein
MANGFYLNETACRQIYAEGRTMRHFRNSLAVTQPISADKTASFSQHRKADLDRRLIHRSSPGTASLGRCSRVSQVFPAV